MKVIEKLFQNYLTVPSDQYVNKYLAAKAIIDITEDENSDIKKKMLELRGCISQKCPISVFKAEKFLKSTDTTLTIEVNNKKYTYSKMRGHDYLINEYLGDFLDKINEKVVKSLSGYNTDRSRSNAGETEIPE